MVFLGVLQSKDRKERNNGTAQTDVKPHQSLPKGYRFDLNSDKEDSPWTVSSPMCTHLHRGYIDAKPMRRQRSRSLGDGHDFEWSDEEHLRYTQKFDMLKPPIRPKLPMEIPNTPEEKGKTENKETENPLWINVMYGLINGIIVVPVLMSFGNIIYRDDSFAPYIPVLIKLTLVSGMIHQICFSLLSSLPFAVGQVQDAGLIFSSQMAATMSLYCRSKGYDDDTMLATVTVGLGLATALLGIGLVIIGRLRLAQLVQALPTPVVGGYLAFIGWFCGVSGLAMMAGTSELTVDVLQDKWHYMMPGLAGGLTIYISARILRHVAVLPTCISLILLLFYLGLWVTDKSIEDATRNGWMPEQEDAPVWYHTWDYLQFDKVVWSAFPPQALTLVSMIFVVALSSSLDIAAIELELKQPLDYNSELSMVGISNLVSGLTGGYTGSYIFSQSIFSLRAGIRSRVTGFVIALLEFFMVVLPFPILSYVPNFFFGSLLVMICVDLVYEWLWEVRLKLKSIEYALCIGTFLFIQFLGVEYGIIAGVIVHVLLRKIGLDLGAESGNLEHNDSEIQKEESSGAADSDPLITDSSLVDNYGIGFRSESSNVDGMLQMPSFT